MDKEYGMFSQTGNRLVAELVGKALELPITTSPEDLYSFLNDGMVKIEKAGHCEVHDTDVRERIIGEIEAKTQKEYTIYF